MSDNGDIRLVLKVEVNKNGGLKVTFGEGFNFDTVSLAVRLASLELDNRLVAKIAQAKVPTITVPKNQVVNMLDKIKQGVRLN